MMQTGLAEIGPVGVAERVSVSSWRHENLTISVTDSIP
jgi:hypothetical protein